jgi:hypothetical protein
MGMADAPRIGIVSFERGPDTRHVVEIELAGAKRRITVRVDDGAWLGLGYFASDPESSIRRIVLRFVELHALDGSLKDEVFITGDEAKEIHWGG